MAKSRSGAKTRDLIRVQVHLGTDQLEELDALVTSTDLARNTQIRRAVDEYLKRARRRESS